MQLQRRSGFCGPAAVVNCLRALGRKLSEARIGSVAGCTPDGCPPEGLVASVRFFGFSASTFETTDRSAAWGWLVGNLEEGRPCIILVMEEGHYVSITGRLGPRVNVFDSTNTVRNRRENGSHVFSKRELMKRWLCSKNGIYSGISVGRR